LLKQRGESWPLVGYRARACHKQGGVRFHKSMIQDDEGEQNTSITIMLLEVPFLIHMIDSIMREIQQMVTAIDKLNATVLQQKIVSCSNIGVLKTKTLFLNTTNKC